MPLEWICPIGLVASVGLAGLTYWLLGRVVGDRARVRRLAAMAPVEPSAIADGAPVRVVGVVRAGPRTLRSPVHDRACVAWLVEGTQHKLEPRGWTALSAGEAWRAIGFFVDMPGGAVWVEAEGAHPHLALGAPHEPGERARNDAIRARLAEGQGSIRLPFTEGKGRSRLAWREGALREGDRVTVAGRARREADPAAPGATRLVLAGAIARLEPGVSISDDPTLTA
ncbi:MAG: hypothetical protein KF729_06250 [Sandaracinaceae bacterium]|nr:hypothetical protein [Sandaracinaceae bacterium]